MKKRYHVTFTCIVEDEPNSTEAAHQAWMQMRDCAEFYPASGKSLSGELLVIELPEGK